MLFQSTGLSNSIVTVNRAPISLSAITIYKALKLHGLKRKGRRSLRAITIYRALKPIHHQLAFCHSLSAITIYRALKRMLRMLSVTLCLSAITIYRALKLIGYELYRDTEFECYYNLQGSQTV